MNAYSPKKAYGLTLLLFLFLTTSISAQVGINTTTPSGGAMLDVESTDKGILIPRVDIADLNTIAPITGGSTTSLLVYNTNTSTGPGFFFWDGSQWVGFDNNDWELDGNAGTSLGTNFLGTTDNVSLSFRTNNTERLRITNDGYLLAYIAGSDSNPVFSWGADDDTGIFRSNADRLNFSAGGREFMELNENGSNSEVVINDGGDDTSFRIVSNDESNMFFVDGIDDAIGVGTATPNGLLDLDSSTMGMVPPRVALTSTIVEAPVVNPQGGGLAAGTTVYNTNTAGSAPNNVAPGLYFWNGSRWVAFAGSPGGLDWTLTGNSGTTAGTNFLGTTDAVALVFSTNSTERMRTLSTGEVVINGTTAAAGDVLTVNTSGTNWGINAYNTGSGLGIFSQGTGTGSSIYGFATAGGTALIGDNNFATGNGIIASGANAPLYSFPGFGSGGVLTGTYGATGVATSSTGTGTLGMGNGRTTVVTDPRGSGIAGSGDVLGVFGYAGDGGVSFFNYGNAGGRFSLDADNDVTTTTGNNADRAEAILAGFNNVTPDGSLSNRDSYFGGYFSGGSQGSGTPSYAYAGMRYNTNANGTSGTDYKIIGTGSVSTLINDENNVPRVMFAPESPEIVFQDYGVGQMVNGEARITLDPTLAKNIRVDANNPMKVFVTLEGDCNGIFVTEKSARGFTVKELQGGNSNVSFSWQIVANREDTKDAGGNITSKHVGLRLPVGPGPIKSNPVQAEKLDEVKDEIKTRPVTGSLQPTTSEKN